jgi:WD40 repeat protein
MSKQLSTHLSTQTIHFTPGAAPQSFDVAVSNLSPQFATFQIELTASGIDDHSHPDWYQLAPELSSKIPAGDRTQFSITIFDVPPVPGGFVGTMTLTVRVFSLELREEDRQVVNLIVEGTGSLPPTIYLSTSSLQGNPSDIVEIPIRVHNANRNTANARITLTGLPPDWIVDGHSRRLTLAAQSESNLLFLCQLPAASEALSRIYPFTVEAQFSAAAVTRVPAQLMVLPSGRIESTLALVNKEDGAVSYSLTVNNQSNVDQQITPQICQRMPVSWWQKWQPKAVPGQATPAIAPTSLQITPDPLPIRAGDTQDLSLTITPQRPWVGWRKQQHYQLTPELSQPESIDCHPETHTVPVPVIPHIPIWVQVLTVSAATALVLIPWLWRVRHHGPVNSVVFDGQAQEVISGSDDQTLRRWRVQGQRLQAAGRLTTEDKAIRVVRYRPVNNNWVATGLENGEIKLWNLLTETPIATLLSQKDDRVFDLRFSRDAFSLYSAHGSGAVLAWDLSNDLSNTTRPQQQQQVDFAVQSLALVGPGDQYLAIAGRFNQIALWDLDQDHLVMVNQPRGQQTDYIVSLGTTEQHPTRLATADNQGQITLWELRNCLTNGQCKQLDQWSHSQTGRAVRAIALSTDGCYLASGGEDGRIKLWQLDSSGRVIGGETVARHAQPINALDVVHLKRQVLITSGGNDHRVRLKRVKADHPSCLGGN